MKRLNVMFIAGEPSGDMLAAELAQQLRATATGHGWASGFFGAGGQQMAKAGVDLAFDMTRHSVIGISDALKGYRVFRRLLNQLVCLALANRPDVIVCVDFSGFNRRFARALRNVLRSGVLAGGPWKPRIIQYVSPQVWASRPGRARSIARDYDLLLAIFPFEKAWYAQRVPDFRVEFVGHPMLDRHAHAVRETRDVEKPAPEILLLPGSRVGELRRHLPVMIPAVERIAQASPGAGLRMVLPNESLAALARQIAPLPAKMTVQVGGLDAALANATLAIASTGTVTMECALFGVPTVALYKTSWSTYQIGRRIVKVPFLAMPNILMNEAVFPEFIQDAATPENLAKAALDLLGDPARRDAIREKLRSMSESLGGSGAAVRAAKAVLELVKIS